MVEKISDRKEAATRLAEIINSKLEGKVFQDDNLTFYKEFSQIIEIGDEFAKNCEGMGITYGRSIENGYRESNVYYVSFSDVAHYPGNDVFSTMVTFEVINSDPAENGWFWPTKTRFCDTSIINS